MSVNVLRLSEKFYHLALFHMLKAAQIPVQLTFLRMSCIFSNFFKLFLNWFWINSRYLRLSRILFFLQIIAEILDLALLLLLKLRYRFLHLTCRDHCMFLWILLVDHHRLSQRTSPYRCFLKYLLWLMTLMTLNQRIIVRKCADLTPPLSLTCKRLLTYNSCCTSPFNFLIFFAFNKWSMMLFDCSDWWFSNLYRF